MRAAGILAAGGAARISLQQVMDVLATHRESKRVPMTLEQWASLDEDEPGEVVDGLLEEDEVPSAIHELVVWLIGMLRAWTPADTESRALVMGSGVKFAVGKNRGRMSDVADVPARRQAPGPPGASLGLRPASRSRSCHRRRATSGGTGSRS